VSIRVVHGRKFGINRRITEILQFDTANILLLLLLLLLFSVYSMDVRYRL